MWRVIAKVLEKLYTVITRMSDEKRYNLTKRDTKKRAFCPSTQFSLEEKRRKEILEEASRRSYDYKLISPGVEAKVRY